MGIRSIGSYIGTATANTDLIPIMKTDWETKNNLPPQNVFSPKHVTIYSDEGNIFEVNKNLFEIRNGSWSSPNNDNSTLLTITSLVPIQSGQVSIYYIL